MLKLIRIESPDLVVLNDVSALNGEDHAGDQSLSQVHQVIVVSIGHVEFARCELRVVCQINVYQSARIIDVQKL